MGKTDNIRRHYFYKLTGKGKKKSIGKLWWKEWEKTYCIIGVYSVFYTHEKK